MGAPTIIPDIFVRVTDNGEIVVELNNGNIPELCVSPSYLEMVRELAPKKDHLSKAQLDELTLVQDKITAADNFINTLKMRSLALRGVAKILVQKQRDFFLNDDDETRIVPMKLSDISDVLGIHVSTVSRVVRSKYLQTPYGTYQLKEFFSSSFISQTGEEQSAHMTRLKLEEVIAAEDKRKPLSDEQIAEAVTALGFPIARRTVTKYREKLGIPEKRLRKQG
jgi:RNA polymerase sigma-54 factor